MQILPCNITAVVSNNPIKNHQSKNKVKRSSDVTADR